MQSMISFIILTFLTLSLHIKADCTVSNGNKNYDLNSLSKSNGDYEVQGQDSKFYLNICKKLNREFTGINKQASAVKSGSSNYDIGHDAVLLARDSDLVLVYNGGETCPNSEKINRKTVIQFVCNKDAGTGSPRYLYDDDCVHLFTWTTSAACAVGSEPLSGTFIAFIILIVVVSVYFIGGVLLRRQQGFVGWEQVPHIDFFRKLLDRVKDLKVPFVNRGRNYDRIQIGEEAGGMFTDDEEF